MKSERRRGKLFVLLTELMDPSDHCNEGHRVKGLELATLAFWDLTRVSKTARRGLWVTCRFSVSSTSPFRLPVSGSRDRVKGLGFFTARHNSLTELGETGAT